MESSREMKQVKIAVIGGGSGSFMLLQELKNYTPEISALVTMSDDGGSTGVLRDELGVLPPGDIRQCLVALSESPKVRDLFNYRFEEGTFEGHTLGNLLLTGCEKMTGSFSEAVEMAADILSIRGNVIPVTLDNVRLQITWPRLNITLHNEKVIDDFHFDHDPREAVLSLNPAATANPDALTAIREADVVVIAPGDIYTSLGPLLVIEGIGEALQKSSAMKVYVSNLVTKPGHTDGFTVSDHADEIERFAGAEFIDYVLYNDQRPDTALAKRYQEAGAYEVKVDQDVLAGKHYKTIAGDFLGDTAVPQNAGKLSVPRSLIRHDGRAITAAIMELYHRVEV